MKKKIKLSPNAEKFYQSQIFLRPNIIAQFLPSTFKQQVKFKPIKNRKQFLSSMCYHSEHTSEKCLSLLSLSDQEWDRFCRKFLNHKFLWPSETQLRNLIVRTSKRTNGSQQFRCECSTCNSAEVVFFALSETKPPFLSYPFSGRHCHCNSNTQHHRYHVDSVCCPEHV